MEANLLRNTYLGLSYDDRKSIHRPGSVTSYVKALYWRNPFLDGYHLPGDPELQPSQSTASNSDSRTLGP